MSERRRTTRDERRRSHAQNFLHDLRVAELICSTVTPGQLIVELGAGDGAITLPLARAGARVEAVEADPVWADRLSHRVAAAGLERNVRVVRGDLQTVPLPAGPYRVVASVPFNRTTALLRRLLDQPGVGPERSDLIVQWEVARKRAARPPNTLLSASWAPWWDVELVCTIPRTAFRPIPAVDAGWIAITKRRAPLLPASQATAFAGFLRSTWSGAGRGD